MTTGASGAGTGASVFVGDGAGVFAGGGARDFAGAGTGVPAAHAGAADAAASALAGAADDVVVPVGASARAGAGAGPDAGAGAVSDGGARGVPPNLPKANENNNVWDSWKWSMLGRTKIHFVWTANKNMSYHAKYVQVYCSRPGQPFQSFSCPTTHTIPEQTTHTATTHVWMDVYLPCG